MTHVSSFIRIVSVPPGEAPQWVREKWVGLELPLAYSDSGARGAITSGYCRVRVIGYRSLEHIDRELRSIEQGYLFCSPYKKLNDPMEGFYASSKRLKNSQKYAVVRDEILMNKRQIGICSFSEVYNNELMWAHYASQFGGIYIAYDLFELLKHLSDEISFVRMFYNEEVPNVGLTKKSSDELAKMVLCYKNHRWLYEREWRMFGNQGQVFYNNQKCVARVYIGSRIDSEQRREIEDRLKPLRIPISTMRLKGYSLSFRSEPKQRNQSRQDFLST